MPFACRRMVFATPVSSGSASFLASVYQLARKCLASGMSKQSKEPEFLFHPVAMDDPNMLPVYAYCEENFIPICMHVNPYDNGSTKGKPGFAEEFVAVLTQFPNLKVDAPHFILSSVQSDRFEHAWDLVSATYRAEVSVPDTVVEPPLKRAA